MKNTFNAKILFQFYHSAVKAELKNREYDLGYDYHECGICKICQDEGCPELASYLCRMDFVLADIINMKLGTWLKHLLFFLYLLFREDFEMFVPDCIHSGADP